MFKRLVLIFSLIFTLGLGLWAYKTNYASRSALLRVESIHKQIEYEQYQIKTLNAEWEFLNRPARLSKLVETIKNTKYLSKSTYGNYEINLK